MNDQQLLRNKKKLLPGSGLSYHKFKAPCNGILATFPNPAKKPSEKTEITFETSEVSALCPLTGQPDWYKVWIRYIPKTLCIESKSAKLYFGAYRDFPGFIETLAEKMFSDWVSVAQPIWAQLVIEMAPRGGIGIKVVKEEYYGA